MKYAKCLLVGALCLGACIPPATAPQVGTKSSSRPQPHSSVLRQPLARYDPSSYEARKARAREEIAKAKIKNSASLSPQITKEAKNKTVDRSEYSKGQSRPIDRKISECLEGQAEIDKARNADENSEKLFHYRRALRVCPQQADFHKALGDFYMSINRVEDAQFEFEESKRLGGFSETRSPVPSRLKY